MLALGLLLSLSSAQAQNLVPTFTGEHSWKIETFQVEAKIPESPNLKAAVAETWGGKLTCKPVEARIESCTWGDNKLYWGWQAPDGTVDLQAIDAPIQLEVTWSPTGRVVSWDIKGDRTQFRLNLANAYAHRVSTGWRLDSPDFLRRLGQELEQRSTLYTLGALDVELPRKGESKGQPWKYTSLPFAMRRGPLGAGGPNVNVAEAPEQTLPEVIKVTIKGDASITWTGEQESSAASGTLLPIVKPGTEQNFKTIINGSALVDRADGRVGATDIFTTTNSTLPIFGFQTAIFRATKWADDLKPEPGAIPVIKRN